MPTFQPQKLTINKIAIPTTAGGTTLKAMIETALGEEISDIIRYAKYVRLQFSDEVRITYNGEAPLFTVGSEVGEQWFATNIWEHKAPFLDIKMLAKNADTVAQILIGS